MHGGGGFRIPLWRSSGGLGFREMTAGIPNHLQHICLASFSARSLVFGMSLRVCVCFAIFAFGGRVPRSWGPGLLGMGLGFRV